MFVTTHMQQLGLVISVLDSRENRAPRGFIQLATLSTVQVRLPVMSNKKVNVEQLLRPLNKTLA
jgi:hypothetical protein